MNPQPRRRVASASLIVGFFVLWELLCVMFHVRDIVLPRPTQILTTLWVKCSRHLAACACRPSTPPWSALRSALSRGCCSAW